MSKASAPSVLFCLRGSSGTKVRLGSGIRVSKLREDEKLLEE